MSIESVMLSSHLILWWSLLLLPSIFPSIRVFSNELALRIRCPKYWNFSISPSNEYSGLISFRMDWLDLLAPTGYNLNVYSCDSEEIWSIYVMWYRAIECVFTHRDTCLCVTNKYPEIDQSGYFWEMGGQTREGEGQSSLSIFFFFNMVWFIHE